MAIIHIKSKEEFESKVLKSQKPVLLDFWATWCIPCRAIGKVVDELDKEQEEIQIAKLNIEECPDMAAELGVMNIPVLMYFKDGKQVLRLAGVQSKKAILKKISKK